MSINLVVASPLSDTPQQVQDASGNNSGLYLTNAGLENSQRISLSSAGHLVFGLPNSGGNGEWLQNSANGTVENFGIAFYGNAQEWMRLTNAGNLGVGTTTPAATVDVAGTLNVSGAVSFPGLPSGSGVDVVSTNGVLGVQTSSARFKENIRELKDDFSRVLSLIPVSFTYKDSGQEAIGYTAEELHEKELHRLVSYDEEGKPFSVNYKMLPVYLLEIVKKQQEMIGQLQQGLAQVLGGSAPPVAMAEG